MSRRESTIDWTAPGERRELAVDRLQIWRIRLDTFADARLEELRSLVSESERERADRFKFDDDRHRHLAGRALVRSVLAEELGRAPGSIAFGTGPHDKPELARRPSDGPALEFNLAHADRWVLAVFRRGAPVGVDVEPLERTDGADGVARRVLTDREFQKWRRIPEARRARFFMGIWTCKEALIKATGEGLYRAPETIECRFDGARVEAVERLEDVSTEVDVGSAERWDLRGFELGVDAAAAVAWRREDADVEFEWIDGGRLVRRRLEDRR